MRSKLTLNLDELTVESFDTTSTEAPRGTVFGEQCTCNTQCTCPGCPTCDASCNGTCGGTCGAATCGNSCYGTCGEYSCGYSCDGYCTQGWDATCNNVGTCDPNAWGGCPITP